MKRRIALCLAAACALVAACGDDAVKPTGSPEQQVRATLLELAVADGARDYGRYCELISDASARAAIQLAGGQGDCAAAIATANGPGHQAADGATVADAVITVSGDTATATSPGGTGAAHLVREDGRWRVKIFPDGVTAPAAAPPAALPSASDSAVKADVRAAVSTVEACATDRGTYVGCDPDAAPGSGSGPVDMRNVTADTYEVVARTPAGSEYRIIRTSNNIFQRVCTAAQPTPSCRSGTW